MKIAAFFAVLGLALFAAPAASQAQHHHHRHGSASTRHCQTDYDHRPHTYHSGTHYHYCPGGAHAHGGSYRTYGRTRRAAAYDPIVADIQAKLSALGMYHHTHHNQVDGIFGNETKHAIEDFQRSKKMPITGRIDADLLAALDITTPTYGDASQQGVAIRTGASSDPAPIAAAPEGAGDILTPDEAARIMRVKVEDVIELLDSGDLVGKKIGSNWRISRTAIDDFMQKQ